MVDRSPGTTYQRKCNEEKSVNTILAAGYRKIKIIKHHSYLSGSELLRSLRHEDVKIFSFSCVYVLRDQILSVGHHLSPSKPQQKKRPRFISDENDGFPKPTSLSATNQEERNNRSQTIFLSLIFQYAISGKDSGKFFNQNISKSRFIYAGVHRI